MDFEVFRNIFYGASISQIKPFSRAIVDGKVASLTLLVGMLIFIVSQLFVFAVLIPNSN